MKKRIAIAGFVLLFLLACYFLIRFAVIGTQTTTFQSTPAASTPMPSTVIPSLARLADSKDAYTQLISSINNGSTIVHASKHWTDFWMSWTIAKNMLIEFILPALSILIVLILIEEIIRRRVFNFDKRIQMTINNFEFGSVSFKNEGLPKSITNEVKEDLYKFYSVNKVSQYGVTDLQEPKNPFRLLNQSVESIEIPAMVPSQISVLLGFVMKLFPPRILNISGQLEYDYEKGVGLSITFDDNIIDHIACSRTLWEKDLKIPPLKLKHSESAAAGNTAAPAVEPSAKSARIAPSTEKPSAQADTASSNSHQPASSVTASEADLYYTRCCVLADIASTWIYYKILKSTNSRKVKEYFGTDDFDSIKWFILFLIHYQVYKDNVHSKDANSLKETAKKDLLQSLRCDQHNSIANFNLGWFLNHSSKPKSDKETNDFTRFLTRAIQTSDPSESTNINANYCLGDYYLNHNLTVLKKNNENIDFLELGARTLCFEKHFNVVSQNVTKSRCMKENAKLAFQIPSLVDYCVFSQRMNFLKLWHIQRIENRKKSIEIRKTNENNVDFYYNLACFYSLVSDSNQLPPNIVPVLKARYYHDDPHKLIAQPIDLYQFSLRNFEIACECDFKKVLRISKNDLWLDNIRAHNKSEYEKIIKQYKALNDVISPEKKKAKGKKLPKH
jgi:hypothetical protein